MLTRAAISGDSFPSVSQHHLTVTTEQKLALENYPLVTRSCAGALQGGKFSKLQWKLFACELTRWTGWSDVCLVSFFCVVVCHCMSSLGCCNSLVSALKVVMSLLVTMPPLRKVRYFFHLHPPCPSSCHHYDESLIKVRSLRPATKARPLHQETITTMRFHISHRSHPGSQVPLSPMAVGEPD